MDVTAKKENGGHRGQLADDRITVLLLLLLQPFPLETSGNKDPLHFPRSEVKGRMFSAEGVILCKMYSADAHKQCTHNAQWENIIILETPSPYASVDVLV